MYAQNSCTVLGVYTPLQAARVSNSNVRRLLEGWTDAEVAGRQLLIARTSAYEAWSQLLIAEAFCETVFSTIKGETIEWGTKITRAQALDSAIARFSTAITTAQGSRRSRRRQHSLLLAGWAGASKPGQGQYGGGARRRGAGTGGIRLERDGVEQQHAPAESRVPGEQYRARFRRRQSERGIARRRTRAIRASRS